MFVVGNKFYILYTFGKHVYKLDFVDVSIVLFVIVCKKYSVSITLI